MYLEVTKGNRSLGRGWTMRMHIGGFGMGCLYVTVVFVTEKQKWADFKNTS